METLIALPSDKQQLKALKAFMKALKIDFKVQEANSYDPDFVAEIEQSRKDIEAGKGVRIKVDDLWK
jgi:cytochrome c